MNTTQQATKSLTISMAFNGAAINRDEKIGGTVLSIKKLSKNKKAHSVLSKPSQRYHLFQTLVHLNPQDPDWTPCEVVREKEVVQFDLSKRNILNSAELDLFGYMNTTLMLMRKSPLGLTKALSIEEWRGDMLFYANHDLVKRANATPNPYSKEEHETLFETTFTLDTLRLGKDQWKVKDGKPTYKDGVLLIEHGNKGVDTIRMEGMEKVQEGIFQDASGSKVSLSSDGKFLVVDFQLSPEKKKDRIQALLFALKNGIQYQVSGESVGIVPAFFLAATLQVPVPVFHRFLKAGETPGSLDGHSIQNALENEYILDFFLQDKQNLLDHPCDGNDKRVEDWGKFVDSLFA
ncbi:MAG TPA: type I-B CRISPR-associated protein Cas7/Cst2/DevR [Thermotogota bacterium]|nr:type I-B CRISPR-associated protein Cas7/Cst2/DevR [Thermotogota bacterium]